MRTLKEFEKFIADLPVDKFTQLTNAFDIVCSFVPEELKDKTLAALDNKVYDEFYKRWPNGNILTEVGQKIRTELAT